MQYAASDKNVSYLANAVLHHAVHKNSKSDLEDSKQTFDVLPH